MRRYSPGQINRAIEIVDAAKREQPTGFRFLESLRLPSNDLMAYAFVMADAHEQRMSGEEQRVIFAAAWLDGLAIGAALAQSGDAGSSGSMPVPEQ